VLQLQKEVKVMVQEMVTYTCTAQAAMASAAGAWACAAVQRCVAAAAADLSPVQHGQESAIAAIRAQCSACVDVVQSPGVAGLDALHLAAVALKAGRGATEDTGATAALTLVHTIPQDVLLRELRTSGVDTAFDSACSVAADGVVAVQVSGLKQQVETLQVTAAPPQASLTEHNKALQECMKTLSTDLKSEKLARSRLQAEVGRLQAISGGACLPAAPPGVRQAAYNIHICSQTPQPPACLGAT